MNRLEYEQGQGRTDSGMNTGRSQRLCVSLRKWHAIAAIDIFNRKKSIPMTQSSLFQYYFVNYN